MATTTATTLADLPSELLYTILSHALSELLFEQLFRAPLSTTPTTLAPSGVLGVRSPSPAAAAGEKKKKNHIMNLDGCGGIGIGGVLKEISSLGSVSFHWRTTVSRLLRAVLDGNNQMDRQSVAGHLTQRCLDHQQLPLLGRYYTLLDEMQATLRSALLASIDRYRKEQDSTTGATTPSATPPHNHIPIPNTNSIPTLTLNTTLHTLRDDGCPFFHLPLFIHALRYTQASMFTAPATMVRRNELVLTTARVQDAVSFLSPMGVSPIRPKEIADLVSVHIEEMNTRLSLARQVCTWTDLLERVFIRYERDDETMNHLHTSFAEMERGQESIELFYLLRSGLFKTVQLVSRIGLGSGEEGEEWRMRATGLSVAWTARVIAWTGL